MPKCDACRADGAKLRCHKCQGCWSCDRACAKRFWRTHKKLCTDDPALKPYVPIELAIERALAKAPKTEPPPENATCYICLETDGPNGEKVTRGCACRGPSAGFAHVDCLAEMASRNPEIDFGGGVLKSRWMFCPTCQSNYFGALSIELTRRRWRRERDNPPSDAKRDALTFMAAELRLCDELDAADVLDEESTRGVTTADPDTILRRDILRAYGLIDAHRCREALKILTDHRPIMERHTDLSLRSTYVYVMATTLAGVGRYEDALPFAVEAVDLVTEAEGPESQQTLTTIEVHAQILASIGHYREAKAAMARVIATRTRVLGADHPVTLQARRTLDRMSACEGRSL